MKQDSKPQTILIPPESNKTRLDIFLSAKLGISRSQIQKMINNNLVEINKKLPKKAGDKVSEGDKINIKKIKKTSVKNQKVDDKQIKNTKYKIKDIKIIKKTDDYLVINKPSGLLVHPTQAKEKNTLANLLAKKYPELKKVGDDPVRPGIVHRLDKDASGLMVIARTQKMFKHLKKQFKLREVDKEYMVLVNGKVLADEGKIDFAITRSKNSDRMAALPTSQELEKAKDALTEFWVEKKFINFTLLRVKIHTGRTHQIRVHMLAYNHPIVGDKIYFQKKQKRKWSDKLGRIFLHCVKLGFKDLDGKKCVFETELSKELEEFLKEIK